MQLMESFHNDMIMMVQMFVAMHREHLSSVRQELEMVQKLTRELGVLQARVAEAPGSEGDRPTGKVDQPAPERKSAQTPNRKTKDKKPHSGQLDQSLARTEPKATEPVGGSKAAGSQVPSAKESEPPESNGTHLGNHAQIHAHLSQRIAELQRERQGYWQRILSTINR
jgi:hypothetical protein